MPLKKVPERPPTREQARSQRASFGRNRDPVINDFDTETVDLDRQQLDGHKSRRPQ